MMKLHQVLIIDDDVVNNLFCKIVIEHSGIAEDVHFCMSGAEGFDCLSACINSGINAPDLILLDINMPLMSGFDFLDHYYKLGYHDTLQTKIVMLTSSVSDSDLETAKKYSSVIDYIVKPLSEGALKGLLPKLVPPSLY